MNKTVHQFSEQLNYVFILWINIAKKNKSVNENEILLLSKRLIEEYNEESVEKSIDEFERLIDTINIDDIINEVANFPINQKYRILIDFFMVSTLNTINNQDIQLLLQYHQFDMDAMTILGVNDESVALMEEIFKRCGAFFLYETLFKILDKNYSEANMILKNSQEEVEFICINNYRVLGLTEEDENFDLEFLLFKIVDEYLLINIQGNDIHLYDYNEVYNFDALDGFIEKLEEEKFLFTKKHMRNHSVYSFGENTLLQIDNGNIKYYLNCALLRLLFDDERAEHAECFLYRYPKMETNSAFVKKIEIEDEDKCNSLDAIYKIQATDVSCGYQKNKAINFKINFEISKGELVAIMGPSGAGKSTLMKALIGDAFVLSGELKINCNDKILKKVMNKIGYVPQDDVLIDELSVYDNLYYNYRLHFGDDEPSDLVERKIHTHLRKLGIYSIKNSKIYKNGKYQISGGQRKRVNIAMELIKDVELLLIDEPTSGLSSVDSEKIIDLLKDIVNDGKIIITVIHQPSSSMYQKFNQVILFNQAGHNIYSENSMDALRMFKLINDEKIYNIDDIHDYADVKCPACHATNPELLLEVQDHEKNDFWNLITYVKYFMAKDKS